MRDIKNKPNNKEEFGHFMIYNIAKFMIDSNE